MDYRREARATKMVIARNQRSRASNKHQGDRNRHYNTIHHRIAEVSEGIQYGVLNISHDAKTTNVVSASISKIICLSRCTPEYPQTALLTGLPGLQPHSKPLGLVFDKWRIQWSPNTSKHLGNSGKTSIADSQDVSGSRSSAKADESTVSPKAQIQIEQNRLPSLRSTRAFTYAKHGNVRLVRIVFARTLAILCSCEPRSSNPQPIETRASPDSSPRPVGPMSSPPQPRAAPHGWLTLLHPNCRISLTPSTPSHSSPTIHYPCFPYTLFDLAPCLD
ncbi:hypothetical protein CRG98_018966 [Punica granatum]|uniref:Uncharacterized protein n=1 Tax=Punica granatum TaxID=22663 RepID=A0A2I0JYU4_PUNGR|nr:hypothetical protein CRG98_018966 [Punica granatum]